MVWYGNGTVQSPTLLLLLLLFSAEISVFVRCSLENELVFLNALHVPRARSSFRPAMSAKKGPPAAPAPTPEASLLSSLSSRYDAFAADQSKKSKPSTSSKKGGAPSTTSAVTSFASLSTQSGAVLQCRVRATWGLHRTPTLHQQLARLASAGTSDDDDADSADDSAFLDGPLAYLYSDVFALQLEELETVGSSAGPSNDKSRPSTRLMLYCYDKWASQLAVLLAKGDELSL